MEETTALITSGLYRYIRHPLYLSLILGGFGVMMKDIKWLNLFLCHCEPAGPVSYCKGGGKGNDKKVWKGL